MSKKEFLKDDMVKLLGGASSALGVLKDEIEERIKDKVEKVILKLDLINKKDFLIVKKMAEEARIQNEKLSKKINSLEKQIVLLNKKFKK
jgi:BMFP domain-containing protein YqiC